MSTALSCAVKWRTSADEGAQVPALEAASPARVAGGDAKSRNLRLSSKVPKADTAPGHRLARAYLSKWRLDDVPAGAAWP